MPFFRCESESNLACLYRERDAYADLIGPRANQRKKVGVVSATFGDLSLFDKINGVKELGGKELPMRVVRENSFLNLILAVRMSYFSN